MDSTKAQQLLNQILGQITGYKNPLSLDQFLTKYAFDVRLPQQVNDSTTGQITWSQSPNPSKFITVENTWSSEDVWEKRPKRQLNSIQDILSAWSEINFTATERYIDSLNIAECDNIYSSENVYRSQDIRKSKNILFCDGIGDSELVAASQRSASLQNCVRVEDSINCSNSFSVIWSKKIVNCFFIEDCGDMFECMFCSHTSNKKFCIANMQYTEEEYYALKDQVIRWILTA